jgi:hypothetical protein
MIAPVMTQRFTQDHVDTWRREGGVVIPAFFTADECAAVRDDFIKVFGRDAGEAEAKTIKQGSELGRFNPEQFTGVKPVPLDCGPALNLIGVHPEIIALAKALLKADEVHAYQCQAWAKFTGEADYDQPFHCDYVNHTLTAPSEFPENNCVTILCYFNDVSEAHGPAHYVSRPNASKFGGPEATLRGDPKLQEDLARYEQSTAGPAGTIFPYTIDIFHRGTNLTAPGGYRYALMTCFRAAHDDAIAFTPWAHTHTKPWKNIFNHASPEQLACFGVQPPGHPFWTPVTIARAQARYPGWDLTPYKDAMKVAEAAE